MIVCVGTPARSDGTVDLEHIERVTERSAGARGASERFVAVVYRSTVPPGTVEGRSRPAARAGERRAERAATSASP